eukprot:gnl/Dysnectes_brevis/2641_a3193_961.p1 GENE.gnl/Dysnectes_brevis/2641_a3193_961~~gnl/Dysnectes_brevis/2641_a3193_961.p1  ORF type:complete len:1286 (-),score=240.18 gnl/Dysnectes_brevis/2641_a3193_961:1142-4999(-)
MRGCFKEVKNVDLFSISKKLPNIFAIILSSIWNRTQLNPSSSCFFKVEKSFDLEKIKSDLVPAFYKQIHMDITSDDENMILRKLRENLSVYDISVLFRDSKDVGGFIPYIAIRPLPSAPLLPYVPTSKVGTAKVRIHGPTSTDPHRWNRVLRTPGRHPSLEERAFTLEGWLSDMQMERAERAEVPRVVAESKFDWTWFDSHPTEMELPPQESMYTEFKCPQKSDTRRGMWTFMTSQHVLNSILAIINSCVLDNTPTALYIGVRENIQDNKLLSVPFTLDEIQPNVVAFLVAAFLAGVEADLPDVKYKRVLRPALKGNPFRVSVHYKPGLPHHCFVRVQFTPEQLGQAMFVAFSKTKCPKAPTLGETPYPTLVDGKDGFEGVFIAARDLPDSPPRPFPPPLREVVVCKSLRAVAKVLKATTMDDSGATGPLPEAIFLANCDQEEGEEDILPQLSYLNPRECGPELPSAHPSSACWVSRGHASLEEAVRAAVSSYGRVHVFLQTGCEAPHPRLPSRLDCIQRMPQRPVHPPQTVVIGGREIQARPYPGLTFLSVPHAGPIDLRGVQDALGWVRTERGDMGSFAAQLGGAPPPLVSDVCKDHVGSLALERLCGSLIREGILVGVIDAQAIGSPESARGVIRSLGDCCPGAHKARCLVVTGSIDSDEVLSLLQASRYRLVRVMPECSLLEATEAQIGDARGQAEAYGFQKVMAAARFLAGGDARLPVSRPPGHVTWYNAVYSCAAEHPLDVAREAGRLLDAVWGDVDLTVLLTSAMWYSALDLGGPGLPLSGETSALASSPLLRVREGRLRVEARAFVPPLFKALDAKCGENRVSLGHFDTSSQGNGFAAFMSRIVSGISAHVVSMSGLVSSLQSIAMNGHPVDCKAILLAIKSYTNDNTLSGHMLSAFTHMLKFVRSQVIGKGEEGEKVGNSVNMSSIRHPFFCAVEAIHKKVREDPSLTWPPSLSHLLLHVSSYRTSTFVNSYSDNIAKHLAILLNNPSPNSVSFGIDAAMHIRGGDSLTQTHDQSINEMVELAQCLEKMTTRGDIVATTGSGEYPLYSSSIRISDRLQLNLPQCHPMCVFALRLQTSLKDARSLLKLPAGGITPSCRNRLDQMSLEDMCRLIDDCVTPIYRVAPFHLFWEAEQVESSEESSEDASSSSGESQPLPSLRELRMRAFCYNCDELSDTPPGHVPTKLRVLHSDNSSLFSGKEFPTQIAADLKINGATGWHGDCIRPVLLPDLGLFALGFLKKMPRPYTQPGPGLTAQLGLLVPGVPLPFVVLSERLEGV